MILSSTSHSSQSNELIMTLAFLIGISLILYKVYRVIKHILNYKNIKAKEKQQSIVMQDIADKKDALENFKKIHAKARDHKKKIEKEITTNPKESTEAFRKMMKR